MSIRIVISDTVLTGHPESVREGILSGYGAGLTAGEIEIQNGGFPDSLSYARSVNAAAVVRSLADLNSWLVETQNYYSYFQTFFSFISNTHSEQANPTSIPHVVTVGAGVTQNETAYGNGLEFWDYDLDLIDPNYSSFSNGRVAGKMLKIKDTLGCSWWEARYRARMTASNAGIWDKYNGYGKIDVAAAIAYAGEIGYDPYYDHNLNKPTRYTGFQFQG